MCLEFPSDKDPASAGPPWALPPHTYVAFLSRPGDDIPTDEHGGVSEDAVGPRSDSGLIRVVHLKPVRTHPASIKDGKVMDFISVWSH